MIISSLFGIHNIFGEQLHEVENVIVFDKVPIVTPSGEKLVREISL